MRVFVSPCDTFVGRHLCRILYDRGVTVFGSFDVEAPHAPYYIQRVVDSENPEELRQAWLDSNVVIYDVLSRTDESRACLKYLRQEDYVDIKTMILLSSIVTWQAIPRDPENPDEVFTEELAVKRLADPAFEHILEIEKMMHRKPKRDNLRTFVIHAGIPYGMEEDWLHPWFKSAWHQEPDSLSVFGSGDNVIPMIHVFDLCNILYNVASTKPDRSYILAVDDGQVTLRDIVRTIAKEFSNGKYHSTKDFLFFPNHEFFLVNLRMAAGAAKEFEEMEWVSQEGFIENISKISAEYRVARNLSPVRIVVSGPPASGKTLVASTLSKYYRLVHVQSKQVIEEFLNQRLWLEEREKEIQARERAKEERDARIAELEESGQEIPAELSQPIDEPTEEELESLREKMDAIRDSLESIKECIDESTQRYNDEGMTKIFRWKLSQQSCRNQGFVLDGYPKTKRQAWLLFAQEGESGDDETGPPADPELLPEYLLTLEVSDETLLTRMRELPEDDVIPGHNDEAGFNRRLQLYQTESIPSRSIVSYFESNETMCRAMEVVDSDLQRVTDTVIEDVGPPRNYGLSESEIHQVEREERMRLNAELLRIQKEREERDSREREAEALAEMQRSSDHARLEEARKYRQQVLEAKSASLREYLMQYVMPTITKGLIEVCQARPDDPIDYLAEYLFKNAPSNLLP